jgi:hypothetical protein
VRQTELSGLLLLPSRVTKGPIPGNVRLHGLDFLFAHHPVHSGGASFDADDHTRREANRNVSKEHIAGAPPKDGCAMTTGCCRHDNP